MGQTSKTSKTSKVTILINSADAPEMNTAIIRAIVITAQYDQKIEY